MVVYHTEREDVLDTNVPGNLGIYEGSPDSHDPSRLQYKRVMV